MQTLPTRQRHSPRMVSARLHHHQRCYEEPESHQPVPLEEHRNRSSDSHVSSSEPERLIWLLTPLTPRHDRLVDMLGVPPHQQPDPRTEALLYLQSRQMPFLHSTLSVALNLISHGHKSPFQQRRPVVTRHRPGPWSTPQSLPPFPLHIRFHPNVFIAE